MEKDWEDSDDIENFGMEVEKSYKCDCCSLKEHLNSKHDMTLKYLQPSKKIDGWSYLPNFLSSEQQTKLIDLIDSKPWSSVIHRRQQFWGPVYYHTTHDLVEIQPEDGEGNISSCMPITEMQWLIDLLVEFGVFPSSDGEDDMPWQILVNEYVENDGIATHFDDSEAFGAVIAGISLCAPLLMSLRKPKELSNDCIDYLDQVKAYVDAGSLYIMRDEARYKWRHGVTRHRIVLNPLTREKRRRAKGYRRVSLTIRHLLNGRKGFQGSKKQPLSWLCTKCNTDNNGPREKCRNCHQQKKK